MKVLLSNDFVYLKFHFLHSNIQLLIGFYNLIIYTFGTFWQLAVICETNGKKRL